MFKHIHKIYQNIQKCTLTITHSLGQLVYAVLVDTFLVNQKKKSPILFGYSLWGDLWRLEAALHLGGTPQGGALPQEVHPPPW